MCWPSWCPCFTCPHLPALPTLYSGQVPRQRADPDWAETQFLLRQKGSCSLLSEQSATNVVASKDKSAFLVTLEVRNLKFQTWCDGGLFGLVPWDRIYLFSLFNRGCLLSSLLEPLLHLQGKGLTSFPQLCPPASLSWELPAGSVSPFPM